MTLEAALATLLDALERRRTLPETPCNAAQEQIALFEGLAR